MPEEPSNAVLLEKIANIRESMDDHRREHKENHDMIRNQLEKLNGQVAKNTEFRMRWKGILAGLTVVLGLIVPVLQDFVTSAITRK